MKRPAFQFYPADWRSNAKLRRCSEAERGAWMDILCLLHDEDEYGVCRWPLADLARAAGVPLRLAKALAEKGVLKGADSGAEAYIHRPSHAGKQGDPVTLVGASNGPVWYCSRLVRDEWQRQRRGSGTRFHSDNQPCRNRTLPPEGEAPSPTPMPPPNPSPTRRVGDRQGDGASSSSSSSSKSFSVEPPTPEPHARDPSPASVGGKDRTVVRKRNDLVRDLAEHEILVSSINPDLIAAADAGVTAEDVLAQVPVHPGKPPAYLLAAAKTERATKPSSMSGAPAAASIAGAPVKHTQPSARISPSPVAPPEDRLQNKLRWLKQQLEYGAITQEQHDQQAIEARAP